ncbi:MAG: TolC family protein [Bacteroidota bacterium]|nr:TolC family protein [Bacteroidota bacterium]
MKKLFTLVSLAIVYQGLAQAPAEKWDLRKCIDYAVKNNISVKQADVQARTAALQLKQAKLYQYPTASFSTGVGPQFGRSIDPTTNQFTTTQLLYQNYNLQGNAQLYNWGRLKNNVISNRFSAEAALVDIEKAANDVSLNVATYYLQVLAAKEQVHISEVQIAQTQAQLDITKKRVDAGALPELNQVELEAQLSSDSSNYYNSKTIFVQNVLSLKALLNLDAAALFEVETPSADKIPLESFADLDPEAVYKLALTTQPQQRSNDLKIKAAEKNVLSNKGGLFPTIGGSYSLASTFNDKATTFTGNKLHYFDQLNQNFRQSLGLGLSIPIFNNGQNRIAYEQSKLNLKNTLLQKEQADVTLKNNIYTAYSNAVNAFEKFNAGKKSVESAQKAYDFAVKRYEIGLLSTIDLITNQNNLLKAKLQQVANQYDYVFKMKLLEFYKGQGLKL